MHSPDTPTPNSRSRSKGARKKLSAENRKKRQTPTHPRFHASIYQFVQSFVHAFMHPSIYPAIRPSIHYKPPHPCILPSQSLKAQRKAELKAEKWVHASCIRRLGSGTSPTTHPAHTRARAHTGNKPGKIVSPGASRASEGATGCSKTCLKTRFVPAYSVTRTAPDHRVTVRHLLFAWTHDRTLTRTRNFIALTATNTNIKVMRAVQNG